MKAFRPGTGKHALIKQLTALGYTENRDGDYIHIELPSVRMYQDDAGIYIPHDGGYERMSYTNIARRLWPYRVRVAVAAHLRASLDGMAVDGNVIPINEIIRVLGDV